eukprot:1144581-Pelagomonas_calceolata.AAC.14
MEKRHMGTKTFKPWAPFKRHNAAYLVTIHLSPDKTGSAACKEARSSAPLGKDDLETNALWTCELHWAVLAECRNQDKYEQLAKEEPAYCTQRMHVLGKEKLFLGAEHMSTLQTWRGTNRRAERKLKMISHRTCGPLCQTS